MPGFRFTHSSFMFFMPCLHSIIAMFYVTHAMPSNTLRHDICVIPAYEVAYLTEGFEGKPEGFEGQSQGSEGQPQGSGSQLEWSEG